MSDGNVKRIDLALQGGGAHGAFTWAFWIACWRMSVWRSRASAAPAPVP